MTKQTTYDNWAGGVITSMRADALPPIASPRGRNSMLLSLAGGQAMVMERPGFEIQNTAPITGRPAVIGQFEYVRYVAGTQTSTHVLVANDGSLSKLVGSTISALDGTAPTPFTTGNLYPTFAVLNDLLFVTNGTDKKKVNNATVQNWGIVAPTTQTVVDSGVAGTPNGTYEIAISYNNSSTGHESSRSPATSVTVAGKKITVSWAAPSDPQVDEVFIHIRKGAIMAQFFKLITGTTPAPNADGAFPQGTVSVSVNVTDAQLTALELDSPDQLENNPPPSNLLGAAAHLSRMFVIDKSNLYFSKVRKPEAFDPEAFEPVNPNDGQDNVACASAFGKLVIWKEHSFYVLEGTDENTWAVEIVDPKIGCASARSIRYHNGYLYWYSNMGPVRWSGDGAPELIGKTLIGPTVSKDAINQGLLESAVTEVDIENDLVLFAVPEVGETRNTLVLPFNAKASTWDSDGWTPFDVASFGLVRDSDGKPWVMAGNYAGRIFKFGSGSTDGAKITDGAGNPLTLSGTVTSATGTTLVDSTASFDITDDGLRELFVYAKAPDGTVQRRRISSNTGMALTIASAWDAIPDTHFTYVIAAAYWEWDTPWTNDGLPFHTKRALYAMAHVLSDSGMATIQVDIFKDYDDSTPIKTYTFTASGAGGTWDVSLFDVALFGALSVTQNRTRIGRRLRTYRMRFSNLQPNVKVALLRSSLEVSVLSEKK